MGKLSHYYFTHDSQYKVVAFTADRAFINSDEFCELPLVPFDDLPDLYPPNLNDLFIAMSYEKMNKIRKKI